MLLGSAYLVQYDVLNLFLVEVLLVLLSIVNVDPALTVILSGFVFEQAFLNKQILGFPLEVENATETLIF